MVQQIKKYFLLQKHILGIKLFCQSIIRKFLLSTKETSKVADLNNFIVVRIRTIVFLKVSVPDSNTAVIDQNSDPSNSHDRFQIQTIEGSVFRLWQDPDLGSGRIRIQLNSRVRIQAIAESGSRLAGSGSRLQQDPVLGYGRIRFQAMAGSDSRLWPDPVLGWPDPVLGWPDPVLGYGGIRFQAGSIRFQAGRIRFQDMAGSGSATREKSVQIYDYFHFLSSFYWREGDGRRAHTSQ